MTIATHSHPENLPARMPAGAAPVEAQDSALMVFARELQEAANIAANLARTSFVPSTLRGKVEDLTAAILAGQELGLPVMATLRSIDVIQGTPGLRAHAMRGLVQTHGHSVQLVKSTPELCVMRGRRAGESEWQEVTWTIARAEQMALAGKGEWKKQPQTMLVARATGEICRLIASDVLYAMPYAAEELDGMSSTAPAGESSRVTVEEILSSRGTVPAAAGEGPSAPTPEPPGAVQSERMISEAQQKKMAVLMRQHGITDKDTALAFVAEVIGRTVESRNELTLAEAGRVIDTLEREPRPEPGTEQAPPPPPAGASASAPSEADALWQQIVAAWPGTTSELNTAFAQVMGGVAPEKASEAELDEFLKKLRAGEL